MKSFDRILSAYRVDGKGKFKLAKYKTDLTDGFSDKKEAREKLAEIVAEISELQMKFYADAKHGLLVIFQAMDTGGKDGVIRKVIGPLNAQGVNVTSFKQPSPLELSHDYLWRVHPFIPAKGMIRVFNRSYFEDVLVHRVHKLIPGKVLDQRYRQLNDFERYLAENGIVILKFFLHISKEEQKSRLEARLRDPEKRWKFSTGDLAERQVWERYQEAYDVMLDRCSAPHAPWYVVPSDTKWYRDIVVAEVIRRCLKGLKPVYPQEQEGLDQVVIV